MKLIDAYRKSKESGSEWIFYRGVPYCLNKEAFQGTNIIELCFLRDEDQIRLPRGCLASDHFDGVRS